VHVQKDRDQKFQGAVLRCRNLGDGEPCSWVRLGFFLFFIFSASPTYMYASRALTLRVDIGACWGGCHFFSTTGIENTTNANAHGPYLS
jgi:hypothetical protein